MVVCMDWMIVTNITVIAVYTEKVNCVSKIELYKLHMILAIILNLALLFRRVYDYSSDVGAQMHVEYE